MQAYLVLLHNIHNFLHHISQEVMEMARKNTDPNERSFQSQLMTAKNVKLQEVLRKRGE
jgi:hypothetical protein